MIGVTIPMLKRESKPLKLKQKISSCDEDAFSDAGRIAQNAALVDAAKSGTVGIIAACLIGLVCSVFPTPAQAQGGFTITTVAGCSGSNCPFQPSTWGDGGPAVSASLSFGVYGMTKDASGNLLIADTSHQTIRKVSTDGTITTIAGNGSFGFSGDGGPALIAQLNSPQSVAVEI